jgi:hypothetical protein
VEDILSQPDFDGYELYTLSQTSMQAYALNFEIYQAAGRVLDFQSWYLGSYLNRL